MKLTINKVWMLAALLALVVGVSGCKGHVEKNAEGETTSVGVKTDPAATEAVKEAGQDVADATREAGQDVKEGAAQAGDAIAAGAENAVEATGDAAITAKVKSMLIADPEVGAMKIEVDTVDGKVTLTGSAETAYQKKEAGKLASHTEGVKSVNNLITVVPKQ
jgi:osmotically-inducible protein OsmY